MTSYLLPMALPNFEAALRDAQSGSAEGRWVAAITLGQQRGTGQQQAIEALVRLTDDPVTEVRVQALEGLAEQSRGGAPINGDPVRAAIESTAAEIRCVGIEAALAILDQPEPVVAPLLDDADPSVRATAARALGELEAQSACEQLAARLTDPAESVRFAGAIALAALDDTRGEPLLFELLGSRGDQAAEAICALGRLGHSRYTAQLNPLLDRWLMPAERKALVAAATARCGDRQGVVVLTGMLKAKRHRQRMAALIALARLPLLETLPAIHLIFERGRDLEISSAILAVSALAVEHPRVARQALEQHRQSLSPPLSAELDDALDVINQQCKQALSQEESG